MPDAPALTLREALAAVALAIRSELTGGEPLDALEVTFGFAGRRGTVPVAFAAANAADEPEDADELSELAESIAAALGSFRPELWIKKAAIANAMGASTNHRSGSFKRAIDQLKTAGTIESNAAGYRLLDTS